MSKLAPIVWRQRLSELMPGFIVSTIVAAAAVFYLSIMVHQ